VTLLTDTDLLKQKIGIIGGGQLGKMMILEAKKLGFYINILDPTASCPAHSIADYHIVAGFDDEKGIRELAAKSDVLTYELEHIGVDILKKLAKEGKKIYPTPLSLEIIQDKYEQKKLLKDRGIAVPDFLKINSIADVHKAAELFSYPLMLKSCKGGYDGKGNFLIKKAKEIKKGYTDLNGDKRTLMAERYVPFRKEISVIACRSLTDEIKIFPVGENLHQDNILIETKVPADISAQARDKALNTGKKVMEIFKGIGIFCIEMFLTENDDILINEIAPRPHNSGHYSIEGCVSSQFEQHIRAISGLPLGSVDLLRPSVMRNILGEADSEGKAKVSGLKEALKFQNSKVHIYNKTISRPGRKMGHITTTGSTLTRAAADAKKVSKLIKITGEKDE